MAFSRTNIEFNKTYVSEKNAENAVSKFAAKGAHSHIRYTIVPVIVEGSIRYGVLFIGQNALQAGMHFHFNVIA